MVSDRDDRMNFDAFMKRVEKGARIRSQNQLAGALGIHRSAISQGPSEKGRYPASGSTSWLKPLIWMRTG